MNEPPFLVALRVLGRIRLGLEPSAADKSVLKKAVRIAERNMPVGEIGCLILKRELQMPKIALDRSGDQDLETMIERLQKERIGLDKIIASLQALRASASPRKVSRRRSRAAQ